MKSLLLGLFLYIALVWVGGAYLYTGSDIVQFGLKWTAIGLIVLLLLVVGTRLWGWWGLWRAKSAGRPAAPRKPSEPVHEDDAALATLLTEASATLAKAPAFAGKRSPLAGLPMYLLIGPENSGKTSTFINAGLEAQLLAGRVAGASPVVPTRLANIWFAKDAIFIEISGRAFSGDPGRWTQLLRGLRGTSSLPLWRRLWAEPEQGMALHGVIGFTEVTDFTGSSNPERLDQSARAWNERLRAIGEVFGAEFPLYQVITKGDTISFFSDYFKRLPDMEANQVLGCTLPYRGAADSQPGTVFAEAEGKRLTKSFNPLYYALSGRRLTHLAHEPDPARRPQIYEFPREFKRIRSPLVEFLNGLSRPDPLRPGPLLRGYYLTGVREVEVAAMVDPGASRADWAPANLASDATQMFRGDATQLFRAGDAGKAQVMGGRGGLSRRWMFVADLFHSVILADRPARSVAAAEPRIELYRRVAVGLACGLCALLCFAFLWSWTGNRELLNALPTFNPQQRDRLSQLQSLENLRIQVEKLTDYDRNGAPLGLRWGFYSGGKIVEDARKAYFRRFQQLLLNDLNAVMVARLQALPEAPQANDPYEPANSVLKAHLMISSGSCKADPAFASRILKDARQEVPTLAGSEVRALADRQIDYYTSELAYGNPVKVTEDIAARDRARQYLRKITGVEKIYSGILANAEKTLTKTQKLGDLASNYTQVLSGPGEVSAAFTPEGWAFVQKAAKEGNSASSADSCVLGDPLGVAGEWKRDADTEKAIQALYVRDYVDRWKKFLAGLSVTHYASPADAARRLDILASHKSPLLAALAMTANATNFQMTIAAPEGLEKVPLINKLITSVKETKKSAEKVVEAVSAPPADALTTTSDITRAFQPVQWVVPPASETWVVEKNTAYIESLAQLRHAMEEIARAAGNPDPAVSQAADQSRVKAMDTVRQITIGFKSMGVQGIDTEVQRLLEEPITLARNFIVIKAPEVPGGGANRELRALCTRVRGLKYPFQASADDALMADLVYVFAPGTGAIWKYQAATLAEFTVKEGAQWKAKDPAKAPTPEMLAFLNRAQQITDAFFPGGATQPHFTYTLRPHLDPLFGNSTVELDIDGQLWQWTNSLQHQFSWPALPGAKESGGRARIKGNASFAFASRGGFWGIFRIMGDAEAREVGTKLVEWKYLRAGDGRKEPIEPAPVRLEIVEFPGGVDVFNPKFFQGLGCPTKAVQ